MSWIVYLIASQIIQTEHFYRLRNVFMTYVILLQKLEDNLIRFKKCNYNFFLWNDFFMHKKHFCIILGFSVPLGYRRYPWTLLGRVHFEFCRARSTHGRNFILLPQQMFEKQTGCEEESHSSWTCLGTSMVNG